MLSGIFGHGGCNSCSTPAICGCTTPVTCTTAAPDCGCKPVCGKCRSCHLGNHWRVLHGALELRLQFVLFARELRLRLLDARRDRFLVRKASHRKARRLRCRKKPCCIRCRG